MSSAPALELHGIAKLYGRTAALKATSICLNLGETLLLLGPNGAGKTTLLKILAGAITPTLGSGSIFGRDLVRDRPALRSQVGLLATETYLYEDLSALENLRFILTMAGKKPRHDELMQSLQEVDLDRQAEERVRSFSSGMKQRLALARLLLLRPNLLLLDEPYTALDAAGADLIDALVRNAAREGKTTVMATHDAERGLALATVVAQLDRGALSYFGSVTRYRMRHAHHVG